MKERRKEGREAYLDCVQSAGVMTCNEGNSFHFLLCFSGETRMARQSRQNALRASGLFLVLLHVVSAQQRPQSISDTGGGAQRQQQQLQLLLQQQQLQQQQQQQQQQQRGVFRQRARTNVVSESAARQRVFAPSPTRRPSSASSLFNPAQRRQNNPLFRNRRVNFLRPKTAPPPPLITRPPPPPPRPTAAPVAATPPSPPPPPPPRETTFAYEEGVAYVRGENPTLVTLGSHDSSEDYSESVDELDDQGRPGLEFP